MDPETALGLVRHGATLLLLDVPQYTLIGIDTQSVVKILEFTYLEVIGPDHFVGLYRATQLRSSIFSVFKYGISINEGPVFKGIKMIPPGAHFVYYSSSTKDGSEFSPIVGFFIDTCPSEVIVRKWDRQNERLVKLPQEEEERYCQSVKSLEFDRYLGPYALSQYGDWKWLSNYITKTTIERIEPIGGEITVAHESGMVGTTSKTSMEKALDQQLQNCKFSNPSDKSQKMGCYYTSIPHVVKDKGVHGQELTALNLDKTRLLESILMKDYGGSEDLLLGELQFSFIAFLMGQSLEAFIQWKSLVSLLLGCTEAPFHTRSLLFAKFIKVIYYQLKYGFGKDQTGSSDVGKGPSILLDESWFSADNFLHRFCKDFFSLVQEASVVDGDLLSWTRKLRELLENTLGWDFQQTSMVDGLYCEEGEVSITCHHGKNSAQFVSISLSNALSIQFAPVVETLGDPS